MSTVGNNVKYNARLGGITGKGFQPGQSGNPKGRPKAALGWGAKVRAFLDSAHPKHREITEELGVKVRSREDVLLLRLEKENPALLLAYAYGKPTEIQEVSEPATGPIVILWPHECAKGIGNGSAAANSAGATGGAYQRLANGRE